MEKFERLVGTGSLGDGDIADLLDEHSEAIEALEATHETPWTDRDGRLMTASGAADIILAESDKLLDTPHDPELRVWTQGVAALMVAALREKRREDR